MRIEISVNTMRLYNGRRSFYASIQIGSYGSSVQYWDTDRVLTDDAHERRESLPSTAARLIHRQRTIYRGPVQTWTWYTTRPVA